LLKKK
jgi:Ca2+-binding EF-hand superfamily protein